MGVVEFGSKRFENVSNVILLDDGILEVSNGNRPNEVVQRVHMFSDDKDKHQFLFIRTKEGCEVAVSDMSVDADTFIEGGISNLYVSNKLIFSGSYINHEKLGTVRNVGKVAIESNVKIAKERLLGGRKNGKKRRILKLSGNFDRIFVITPSNMTCELYIKGFVRDASVEHDALCVAKGKVLNLTSGKMLIKE